MIICFLYGPPYDLEMMYSSLTFKNDTQGKKTRQCALFSMYISTDVDFAAKIQNQTRPRFTRLSFIADIGPWETYSGLPLQHTDRTLDITHPVELSSLDVEVIRDNTVVIQMDP